MNPATNSSATERWQPQPGDVLLVTDIQNDFLPGGSHTRAATQRHDHLEGHHAGSGGLFQLLLWILRKNASIVFIESGGFLPRADSTHTLE
jgi:hypothetical protein